MVYSPNHNWGSTRISPMSPTCSTYLNDLTSNIETCDVNMYANDTEMEPVCQAKQLNQLEQNLMDDLANLISYLNTKRL